MLPFHQPKFATTYENMKKPITFKIPSTVKGWKIASKSGRDSYNCVCEKCGASRIILADRVKMARCQCAPRINSPLLNVDGIPRTVVEWARRVAENPDDPKSVDIKTRIIRRRLKDREDGLKAYSDGQIVYGVHYVPADEFPAERKATQITEQAVSSVLRSFAPVLVNQLKDAVMAAVRPAMIDFIKRADKAEVALAEAKEQIRHLHCLLPNEALSPSTRAETPKTPAHCASFDPDAILKAPPYGDAYEWFLGLIPAEWQDIPDPRGGTKADLFVYGMMGAMTFNQVMADWDSIMAPEEASKLPPATHYAITHSRGWASDLPQYTSHDIRSEWMQMALAAHTPALPPHDETYLPLSDEEISEQESTIWNKWLNHQIEGWAGLKRKPHPFLRTYDEFLALRVLQQMPQYDQRFVPGGKHYTDRCLYDLTWVAHRGIYDHTSFNRAVVLFILGHMLANAPALATRPEVLDAILLECADQQANPLWLPGMVYRPADGERIESGFYEPWECHRIEQMPGLDFGRAVPALKALLKDNPHAQSVISSATPFSAQYLWEGDEEESALYYSTAYGRNTAEWEKLGISLPENGLVLPWVLYNDPAKGPDFTVFDGAPTPFVS